MFRRLALIVLGALLLAGCGPAAPRVAPPEIQRQVTPVVDWNEAMLAAIRRGSPRPTVITRQMFMVHAAMYDAWTAYDAVAQPAVTPLMKMPLGEHTLTNKTAAVSHAAYALLTAFFPDYEAETGAFAALLARHGEAPPAGNAPLSPAEVGRRAAAAVLAARAEDGSNWEADYADVTSAIYPILYSPINSADPESPAYPGGLDFNPNYWQPLRVPTGTATTTGGLPVADPAQPASYADQKFLTPHWGAVTPFALTSGDQFRPPPPPRYGDLAPYTDALGRTTTGDEAYHRQFTELLLISARLTDAQKVIAEYWADGPRSESPPGHWNALAHGLSWRDGHTLDDDVRLFFALNGALLDAGIATWEAKRHYDFIRPQSAIRFLYAGQMVEAWGGPDAGARWILGDTWRPYQELTFVTPPFAEYTSGHSAFSAAAAAVLSAYCGSDRFYDGETTLPEDFNDDGQPDLLGQHIVYAGHNRFEAGPAADVVLQWPTLWDAADEAGISRLYGGIHIQDGDLRGREIGRQVGEQAFARAQALWLSQP